MTTKTTGFDKDLPLTFKPYNGGFLPGQMVEGFTSIEQASAWANWWKDQIGWGYSPSARVTEIDGKITVITTAASSCD